ncbi:MAG: AbrB/MazE/SpoVT family DNA-binding domain-containing protein [Propionibacteriaceae bacterium]|jgi:AbrB family looped-hinge helix DNA binding protein|nr:AbrB/MazE/SpoVT family DNA-binding domain-containing protein [Propionibacteriaceae bacterium]
MPTTTPNPGPFSLGHLPSPGRVFGTATVGERGQIAIPADARREFSICSGDKVVVFGNKVNGAITLIKADVFEEFADFFLTKLGKLNESAQEFFAQFVAAATGAEADAEAQFAAEAAVAEQAAEAAASVTASAPDPSQG